MAANEEIRPPEQGGPNSELISELRAIRPRPSEEFRRRLDARAADGFPPRRRDHGDRPAADDEPKRDRLGRSIRERLRLPESWRLGPALAGVAVTVAVATAVIVSGPEQLELNRGGDSAGETEIATEAASATRGQAPGLNTDTRLSAEADAVTDAAAPTQQGFERLAAPRRQSGAPIAADRDNRAVERNASITLATDPAEVDAVAAGVLRVVDSHRGIVISSTTRGGLEGEAGAEFALKIPSSRLSSALAGLSELAAVRHRSESTLDITAPTVTVSDRLREAQARVRGLLKQLAAATTEQERETIEIDLAPAQRRVARLRTQLDRLQRRANYADVRVAIVTGEAGAMPQPDSWTIADAADDALRVLTIVAGVLLIAAAILIPISLLVLAGWVGRRLWLRGARERALRQSGGGAGPAG